MYVFCPKQWRLQALVIEKNCQVFWVAALRKPPGTEYFQRLPEHVNKIMSIVRELEPYKMKILSHDLYNVMT